MVVTLSEAHLRCYALWRKHMWEHVEGYIWGKGLRGYSKIYGRNGHSPLILAMTTSKWFIHETKCPLCVVKWKKEGIFVDHKEVENPIKLCFNLMEQGGEGGKIGRFKVPWLSHNDVVGIILMPLQVDAGRNADGSN